VFPFIRFPGIDIILGPEMKATGEVMGIADDLGVAYAKSQMAAQPPLPEKGNLFVSVKDNDKSEIVPLAKELVELGFQIYATAGTALAIEKAGIPVRHLFKISEGRPNVLDLMKNGDIDLIINTPSGKTPRKDEIRIRSLAVANRIPILTTISAVEASIRAIRGIKTKGIDVRSLQEYHADA
jgi:carbamoyl-phosphate synthase large subunit